jgi:hypothetical protein
MNHLSMCSFAQYMISQSNFLAARYVDLSYWLDPESPMPFVLIADFGHKIAQEFESIGEKDWSELVSLIEEGLNSEDEYIETAVATGLIEAIVHVAEPIHGLWPRIDAALGPEARAYAEAYRNAPFMNR